MLDEAAAAIASERSVRVLLIDDSAAVRSRLARMLEEQPEVDIEEAEGVAEALEAVRRRRPDVVVLDIRLRGGSGLDVLRSLKSAPAPPVVIMLTNHASDHHRRWCREHGADFFFDKASEFDKVVDVLSALR